MYLTFEYPWFFSLKDPHEKSRISKGFMSSLWLFSPKNGHFLDVWLVRLWLWDNLFEMFSFATCDRTFTSGVRMKHQRIALLSHLRREIAAGPARISGLGCSTQARHWRDIWDSWTFPPSFRVSIFDMYLVSSRKYPSVHGPRGRGYVNSVEKDGWVLYFFGLKVMWDFLC